MPIAELSGRDLGRRIFAGIRSYIARSVGDLHARMETMQHAIDNTPTVELMRGEIEAAIGALQLPLQPATDPAATQEALERIVASRVAEWALDFERRAQTLLQGAMDRIPVPANGADGKDGRDGNDGRNGSDGRNGIDGGSIEDFDIGLEGRILTVAMKIGGQVVSRAVRLDIPIERGVYQSGKTYERGDIVTYAGSSFIAQRDTTGTEKPEASQAWRLMVKRGRDGKDSE